MQTIFLVLPAYNEGANLPELLDHVAAQFGAAGFDYTVAAVDDGSTDDTAEVLASYAQKMPVRAIRHVQNQGLGLTIRDGLLEASRLAGDDDVIVSMDADRTHDPGLVPRMVEMIRAGHDVVIASRFRPHAEVRGLSFHRRVVSWFASIVFRTLFPIPGVRDYTCGFRAYRAIVLKQAFEKYGDHFVDQRGFQCMADILLKLRKMQWTMGETPMILRYDLKGGASKMHLFRTVLGTLRLITRRLVNQ